MNLQDLANTPKYIAAVGRPNKFAATPIPDWNSLAGTVKSSVAVEALITWLTNNGITVGPKQTDDYDKTISGVSAELKMSTLNKDGGYIWNQIRPTQDYGVVIFTAIRPTDVRLYWCTKAEAESVGTPQHAKNGDVTLMITHQEGEFPSVFKEFTTAQPGLHTSPLWFTG